MKGTRILAILHLAAAPAFAWVLWDDSVWFSLLLAASLAVSAVLLWQQSRWVVIVSGVTAILGFAFLFVLPFAVLWPGHEIMNQAAGGVLYVVLQAAAVLAEWLGARTDPEIVRVDE